MSEDAGKKNLYTCQTCRGQIVTVNRDAGTTPFMIDCEAPNPGTWQACRGVMYSNFYPAGLEALAPSHEWYRPTSAGERKKIPRGAEEHIAKGGLLLRALTVKARTH